MNGVKTPGAFWSWPEPAANATWDATQVVTQDWDACDVAGGVSAFALFTALLILWCFVTVSLTSTRFARAVCDVGRAPGLGGRLDVVAWGRE